MHHLYPVSKGDQLCPLGFHPQVRWPTRCKRCFRDYKEHGGRRTAEDAIASTPNLSEAAFGSRATDESRNYGRNWTSTQNLSTMSAPSPERAPAAQQLQSGQAPTPVRRRRPASWTSTPDLNEEEAAAAAAATASSPGPNTAMNELSVTVPRRRHTTTIVPDEGSLGRPPLPPSARTADDVVILKTDTLAERYRKSQILKRQQSLERDQNSDSSRRSSEERETRKVEREKSPKPVPELRKSASADMRPPPPKIEIQPPERKRAKSPNPAASVAKPQAAIASSQDVKFLIQVKNANPKPKRDTASVCTDTTDNTLVGNSGVADRDLLEQLESLKQELEVTKQRCEKAERDKSDLMLRRLASKDTVPNKTAASEALKLQQRVNELTAQMEDLKDDKKNLTNKVRQLEQDLDTRPSKTVESDLRQKLDQTQQLCEELMDENEDMKRDLQSRDQEMDEIHDTFRECNDEEYRQLRDELAKAAKNCRVLSFKLKKADRKIEQFESERQALGANVDLVTRVKQLEEQLKEARELARSLESDGGRKRAPSLATIGKSTSADGKVSRGSLIRSGSQEDPGQLQLDLHASMEREADLREQLKFAQEEGEGLRKKASRIEDENESLMMQLKKMATRARTRKLSPTPPSRLSPIPPVLEKDEGISDEEDPAELRLLLELNEQEASVLRRKVEELETENDTTKRQIKELEEKLLGRDSKKLPTILSRTPAGINAATDKRIKGLEEDLTLVRKKLAEKDKEIEQLRSVKDASKIKSDSSDTKTIDFKRKLEMVEQEMTILRTKCQKLELENDKMSADNKKLTVQLARGANKKDSDKPVNATEINKLKEDLKLMELERDEFKEKLKKFMEIPNGKLPDRTPKKYSDTLTKLQIKKLIEDLESEVIEARAFAANAPGVEAKRDSKSNGKADVNLVKQLEATKTLLENQLKLSKDELTKMEKDLQKETREKDHWESKVAELDGDLQAARKNAEKVKNTLEKEVTALKVKALTPEGPTKKLQELKKQVSELEANVSNETALFKDLTAKYELLEEEHVLMKARLTTEKDKVQTELNSVQGKVQDISTNENKLKVESAELSRKLRMAESRLKDIERSNSKNTSLELERNQLRSKLGELEGDFKKLKRENDMNVDKAKQSKKETDDLRQKLDDFERVHKVQRSLNDHNAELENKVKGLQTRLENAELSAKSEVASTRLRYEQQMNHLKTELSSMQSQCERFKRDRDSFKQLLEGAQKKISDLKQSGSGRQSRTSVHSDDDDKSKIHALEQQIGCLEDELSECRLDQSKLKTELVSEKTASEIRIAEMQSQINEYEEERLLSGGSKIPGTKTRIELSWQKEREEQQRLLQETSTLARDLRQTLFEVERERDKERLEMRRKLEQLKKNTDDEMEEGRRKISELQCDLLELRDAHAKLRTANEKLRRERERHEKEREYMSRKRQEQDGDRKVGALLQTVDELVKIAPDLKMAAEPNRTGGGGGGNSQHLNASSAAARRDRSPSPSSAAIQIGHILARLSEASEDLRRYQRICEDDRERDRLRRGGMRRAASTEHDNSNDAKPSSRGLSRHSQNNGSLMRKSLSLDQSMQQQNQSIWKQDDGSMSSMASIDSDYGQLMRDSSLDSRLSGGSTQSDLPRGQRKKKRGIMGKLRSLTRTRGADSDASQQGSDSDLSLAGDHRGSKQNIKGRLSGMFRRSVSVSNSRGSIEKISTDAKPVAVQTICTDALPATTQPPPSPNPSKLKTTRTVVNNKPPTPNSTPITATLRKTNIKLK